MEAYRAGRGRLRNRKIGATAGRLPGLGHRSARKAALTLLKRRDDLLVPLAAALTDAAAKIVECPTCGNIDTVSPCTICQDPRRDRCADRSGRGDRRPVGAGAGRRGQRPLSRAGRPPPPLDGIGPERLNIGRLIERAGPVTEILLALNATVEGQSTAHYLTEQLQGRGITVSRLAQGVPMGGELDYLDEGTLAAAIKSRRTM